MTIQIPYLSLPELIGLIVGLPTLFFAIGYYVGVWAGWYASKKAAK